MNFEDVTSSPPYKELKEKLDYAVKQKIYYIEQVDELRRENKEFILKMIHHMKKLKV